MKGLISKIWKDPVWSTMIATTLVALFGILGNLLTKGWLLSSLKMIWNVIISLLFFKIAIIWILCGLAGIVVVMCIYIRIRLNKEAKKGDNIPFLSYTEDIIGGYKYRWSYAKGYNGKYTIIDMQMLCPNCNTPMNTDYNNFDCPRCDLKVNMYQAKELSTMEAIIVDNINRTTYK